MLKVLAALSLLQLVALTFLVSRLGEANERLALAEAAIAARAGAPAQIVSAPSAPRVATVQSGANALDAETLRRVVREEVAALRIASASSGELVGATGPVAPDSRKSAAVRRDFDRLLTMRRVETRDLDRFVELATALPEGERKKALSDLSRAINDGRIEGQF